MTGNKEKITAERDKEEKKQTKKKCLDENKSLSIESWELFNHQKWKLISSKWKYFPLVVVYKYSFFNLRFIYLTLVNTILLIEHD